MMDYRAEARKLSHNMIKTSEDLYRDFVLCDLNVGNLVQTIDDTLSDIERHWQALIKIREAIVDE